MSELMLEKAGRPVLRGARDPETGACWFPFRPLTADGALRACEEVALSETGVLFTWTRFAGRDYGQIDLPEAVRIQCELGEGPHEIGATYRLRVKTGNGRATWRFERD